MKGRRDRSMMNKSCDENEGELGWGSDSVGEGSEGEGRGNEIGGLERGDDVDEEEVGVNSISDNDLIVNSSEDEDDKKFVGTRDDRGKRKAIENGFSQKIRQGFFISWPIPKRLRSNLILTDKERREDLETMLMLAIDPKQLKIPFIESSMKLEDIPGPFSSALKAIRERKLKCAPQQLIEWKPLEKRNSMIRKRIVPSLLDLSLRALAKNSEAIVSLDHIPDWLRQRFTNMLCDSWKMNSHVLNLLLKDSPTEIRVKDCTWITDAQTCMMFGKLDTKNLRVLQLDLFGPCAIEDILYKSVIQSPNSLMCLRVISLRGTCRLSDELLMSLVTSAPLLQSVNVGQSSLLTHKGIRFLADSLAPSLRELYIDYCPKINPKFITDPLSQFRHLEVLSVAGIWSVSDAFIICLAGTNGSKMKELNLEYCRRLTDESLRAIGGSCPKLESLNISDIKELTDFGLLCLTDGCRSVRTLKCCRNQFSDDAIAAFLEASGESLEELSLNGVSKVGTSTALSLAKHSRKLSSLDLSWCRRISNKALGLVVDSCSSLKLLKIFGCRQIKDKFLRGHRNTVVQIVGLNLTPLLENVNMLQPEGVVLRYSPISDDFPLD